MSTIEEIRARAAAATPGPWHWSGNTDVHRVSLMSMAKNRLTVMTFRRWGFQSAKPVFNDGRALLEEFEPHVIYQVAPGKKKGDPAVYREDFFEIDMPDAQFIAHARHDVDLLLLEVDELSSALALREAEIRDQFEQNENLIGLLEVRAAEIRDLDNLCTTQALSIKILEALLKQATAGHR